MKVRKRLSFGVLLAGLLLVAGSAGAGGKSSSAGGSARAFAVRVVVPGQSGAEVGTVTAPPYHVSFGEGFAYPADGSVATTGSLATSATSDTGTRAVVNSSGEAQGVSLFGGEVTASAVSATASASTRGSWASCALSPAGVNGRSAPGQPLAPV